MAVGNSSLKVMMQTKGIPAAKEKGVAVLNHKPTKMLRLSTSNVVASRKPDMRSLHQKCSTHLPQPVLAVATQSLVYRVLHGSGNWNYSASFHRNPTCAGMGIKLWFHVKIKLFNRILKSFSVLF